MCSASHHVLCCITSYPLYHNVSFVSHHVACITSCALHHIMYSVSHRVLCITVLCITSCSMYHITYSVSHRVICITSRTLYHIIVYSWFLQFARNLELILTAYNPLALLYRKMQSPRKISTARAKRNFSTSFKQVSSFNIKWVLILAQISLPRIPKAI